MNNDHFKMINANFNLANDLPQKTLFRPDEVAEFFDVAKSTVYRWVENGNLQGCRPSNGTIRIFRESIIKLLNKN